MATSPLRALRASVAVLCALMALPVAAEARPRELLVMHDDGRMTTVRDGRTTARAAVARRPGVRYVEPNWHYRVAGSKPDDPMFSRQWALRDNSVLGIQSAWNRVTGAPVTVAVIDTGVDVDHPDLDRNLWTNPGEIPGNGIDDDHDGAVDDVHGWNSMDGSGDITDRLGHGTAVAGVIAARGNNDRGVAGIAWRARIMVLKALNDQGVGTALSIAQAINYAVAHGAAVINLSFAGSEPSQAMGDALVNASRAGVIVTVAAGNQSQSLDAAPEYPAAYAIPHLLAVAATDRDGGLRSDSNFSRSRVQLAAPGSEVLTTAPDGGYQVVGGTSFAAPAVAAAIVLVKAADSSLRPDETVSTLLGAASSDGVPVAYGSLNIAGALRRVLGSLKPRHAKRKHRHRHHTRKRSARGSSAR